MISNGIVALGGAFLVQFVGRAATDTGVGAIVTGLCSIVIGIAITKHISPNFLIRMAGVVVGAIIYYVIFHSISAIKINNKKKLNTKNYYMINQKIKKFQNHLFQITRQKIQ